jgi:hypothetical protein
MRRGHSGIAVETLADEAEAELASPLRPQHHRVPPVRVAQL